MRVSGQMARARARWSRARAVKASPKRAGMGDTRGLGLGIMFVSIVGLLMLATLSTSGGAGQGLSGTGQIDQAGQGFLQRHGAELRRLLADARSGNAKKKRAALKRYDRLVKKAPRSIKMELVRHYG